MKVQLISKLKCIFLVDDDPHSNFFNERALKKADCVEEIKIYQDASSALDYFQNSKADTFIRPEFLFLDINMPGMNGWEFLEAYKKLDEETKARVVIVMLTTSLSPADREKAKSMEVIQEFNNKPLSQEGVLEIIQKHFPHLVS